MKKFIHKHIIAIFIILILIILLITNVVIRNQRIKELEEEVNSLEFEKEYILFSTNDALSQ